MANKYRVLCWFILIMLMVGPTLDAGAGWATLDTEPPVSSVDRLPSQSPGPFTVTWSGVDNGPSGLKDYDIQVRDLSGGAWADWLVGTTATSASFKGVGGQTYFFRSRARDNAGNVELWPAVEDTYTRVESCPPRTAVSPLPVHFAGSQLLRWDGVDLCGSELGSYDVQFRDLDGGAWTDLEIDTRETRARVAGLPGHRYAWRSRGADTAYNVEPWPPGDGDAASTVYAWSVTGEATDSAGRPVAMLSVGTTPAADYVESGLDGSYGAYLLAPGASYVVSWGKAGYGTLPATPLTGTHPARIDVVLPPADDTVQNGGMESGTLDNWTAIGTYSPVIVSLAHTGAHAARLGVEPDGWGPPVSIGTPASGYGAAEIAIDGEGQIHVVWSGSGEVWYAHRAEDGSWSAPENVSNSAGDSEGSMVVVDASGTVHVAWSDDTTGNQDVYYRQRATDGSWQAVENASNTPLSSWLQDLAVDDGGIVHTLWSDPGFYGGYSGIYTRRGAGGTWSAPYVLAPGASGTSQRLLSEKNGIVHALWSDIYNVRYARSGGNGSWAHEQALSEHYSYARDPQIAIDAHGGAHAVWTEEDDDYSQEVAYAYMAPDGTWSLRQLLSNSADNAYEPQVAVDNAAGIVHVIWNADSGHGYGALYYTWRPSDGNWSVPQRLADSEVSALGVRLEVDARGTAHALWQQQDAGPYDIYYASRLRNGAWSAPLNLSGGDYDDTHLRLSMDGNGGVHATWLGGDQPEGVVYHAGPAPVSDAGESGLSQVMQVPADGELQVLSFLYRLHGASEAAGTSLNVELDDGLAVTTLLSTAAEQQDWTHFWSDLTPWAGETVTLTFRLREVADHPYAWAYLDQVSLGSVYPDVWAAQESASAEPGSQVMLKVTCGNRGVVPASEARLSLTLPPELTFLAANPPADALLPVPAWDLGALDPVSGPYTLVITAGVAGSSPSVMLTDTLVIATTSPELELENNTATGVIHVQWRRYLPLITRSGM